MPARPASHLNRLHVWWARRPLTVSRAAIVGGVLPARSADWPAALREQFPTADAYHAWFLRFLGIFGDPTQGRKLLAWTRQEGRFIANPYNYARAFTVNPSAEDLAVMGDLLEYTWGTRDLSVLDPFAGDGSIPFEALRYGFTTIANDLNPVAAVILKATLDYPARFGPELADDIRKWGDIWAVRVKEKLAPYFSKQPGESSFAYLWARTVACPVTGKPVPLSPNWWLKTGDDPVAVQLIAEEEMAAPRFAIVTGAAARAARPDEGTITRGVGRSPWTGETISGDYVKAEAQAGRMGQMLYAGATKVRGGFEFRVPSSEDLEAVRRAEVALAERKLGWIAKNVMPTEEIGISNYDRGHRLYGINRWPDFFSPRQLYSVGVYSETLREVLTDIGRECSSERCFCQAKTGPLDKRKQTHLGYKALLKLAHQPGLVPNPEDDFFLRIAGEKRESLVGRLNQLSGEARESVKALSVARDAAERASQPQP